jgi:hypothetical protein
MLRLSGGEGDREEKSARKLDAGPKYKRVIVHTQKRYHIRTDICQVICHKKMRWDFGAPGETRTPTVKNQQILSLPRLPIPPQGPVPIH